MSIVVDIAGDIAVDIEEGAAVEEIAGYMVENWEEWCMLENAREGQESSSVER